MRGFDIGLSALRVNQQTLSTAGNNIANAATPGYHKQRVVQVNRAPLREDSLHVGTGVDISTIDRMRSATLEAALRRTVSQASDAKEAQSIATQIESLLNPDSSSVHASLSNFFNRMEQAANAPEDMTVRREFLTSVSELAAGFSGIDRSLNELSADIEGDMQVTVDRANQLMGDLVDINILIKNAKVLAGPPNDLLDRREQMITELSQYLDVDLDVIEGGDEVVLLGSGTLLVGTRQVALDLQRVDDGSLRVTFGKFDTPLVMTGGKLLAMQEAVNNEIPAERARLASLIDELVHRVDEQHARGIPGSGPFKLLVGGRGIGDSSEPLSQTESSIPIEEGDLYVTITDVSTGIRQTHRISIDPAVESLDDLAAKLNAVPGLTTLVDSVRSTLTIATGGTARFDFAGRIDNQPDLSAMAGTSVPQFSGDYRGRGNDEWTVTFSGAGQIGVTAGLTATVKDQSGVTIAVLNVGEGYAAGTPLNVADGVSLEFGTGTIAATDTFSVYAVADSDQPQILSALGLNTLFRETPGGVTELRPELLDDPTALAMSRTGLPGDAVNFGRLASLRDSRFSGIGGRTFVEELADITADSGLVVQARESQSTQLQLYQERLETDRASISGVDVNEEMLKILEIERAFQAAARFITAIDSTLQELLSLIN